MKKNTLKILMLLLIVTVLVSCKKDNKNVTPVDDDVYVSITGAGNINNTMDVNISNAAALSGAKINIGAALTKGSSADIKAIIEVDTTLLKAYNTQTGSTGRLMPAWAYTLTVPASGITIKAGSDHSVDSAQIVIKNISALKSRYYILPVRIKSITGDSGAQLSGPASITYLHIILTNVVQTTLSITAASLNNSTLNISAADNSVKSFYALLNQTANSDVKASIVTDTSLINAYNLSYGKSYIALPPAVYKITGSDVTIASNSLQSSTAVQFQIVNPSLLSTDYDYLLPLKISSFSGNGDVDMGNNIVYLHINSSNIDVTGAALLGTLIDRTNPAWSASAPSDYSFTSPNLVLDNTSTTEWDGYIAGVPLPLTIDMKQMHVLKGIKYAVPYFYKEYGLDISPSVILVYTSADGNTWFKQGEYDAVARDPNSSTTNPDIRSIKFITAVNARYFKLVITGSYYSDYYTGISEVNAYQ